jgi:hypothetical protein
MAIAIKFQDSDIDGDVIRRGIKRQLPCTLTEQEFVQIAKMRVDKEALLDQLEGDFARIKKKHNDQVEELEGEIGKMRKELHTGEQDRTVLCVEVFRRAEDGTGWVHTLRMDALTATYGAEIASGAAPLDARAAAAERAEVERRPATPAEAQRYLPGVEGMPVDDRTPLLDQAAAAQAHEAESVEEGDDGVAPELDDDSDDGLSEASPDETLAQRSAREAEAAREARRAAGKKRGRKRKG